MALSSLRMLAYTELTDSTLADLLVKINSNIENSEFDEADSCLKIAFSLDNINNSKYYYDLLDMEATYYLENGEFEMSKNKRMEIVKLLPEIEDLDIHVRTYNELGLSFRMTDQFDSAIVYYNKALDVAALQKDEANVGLLGLNLAVFHVNMRDFKNADTQIKNAINHIKNAPGEDFLLLNAYQTYSFIKTELGEADSSAILLHNALDIATESKNPEWIMRCMPSLLNHFERCGQRDSVQYYLNIGNKTMMELPENSVSVIGYKQARCVINHRLGNYAEAIPDYLYLANGTGTQKNFIYERLALCYRGIGNMVKAFEYMDSARMYTDTLIQADTKARLAEYQVKYESKEKDLQISKMEQERLAYEIKQSRILIILIITIVLLVGFVLYFMIKRRVTKMKVFQLQQANELSSAKSYINGLENERRRLAKELHDGIANDMLGLQLKMVTPNIDTNDIASSLEEIRNSVRNISHELMPPEFENFTLDEIISEYIYKISKDCEINIEYKGDDVEGCGIILHETAYEVYRILQEILSNVIKCSNATSISVYLNCYDSVHRKLVVEDNGQEWNAIATNGGIGLRTIHDRAKTIKATIKFERIDNTNCFTLVF